MATKKTTDKAVDRVEVVENDTTEEKTNTSAKASESTAAEREMDDDIEEVEFTVNVRGKDITLTAPADVDDVPFDASVDMENGRIRSALTKILGERQLMKLRQARARKSDFEKIVVDLNEAWGLGED